MSQTDRLQTELQTANSITLQDCQSPPCNENIVETVKEIHHYLQTKDIHHTHRYLIDIILEKSDIEADKLMFNNCANSISVINFKSGQSTLNAEVN